MAQTPFTGPMMGPLIGIVTGLVSVVLFLSASSGTFLGVMVLFFLAPMPIAIAGIGWGATAAIAAALTGTGIIFALGAGPAAGFYAAAIAIPMAAASYLLMLSRQAPAADLDTAIVLEWYPIGRMVAFAACWAALLAAIALLSSGADLDGIRQTLRDAFNKMLAEGGPLAPTLKRPLTEPEKAKFVEVMIATLPGALATLWLIVALTNIWLAGHATKISGRLSRPWPDLASIQLPPWLPYVFAAAIAATFLGGIPGLIASGFAFAVMAAYVLVGLAIVHWTTRGLQARSAILTATYMSLILINPFSGLILALIGMAEPVSPLQRRPMPPQPKSEEKP